MLNLQGVTKVYKNGFKAVENINLVLKKNEFIFIIGQSGSGKTTLLDLISLNIQPSKGEIIFDGDNVTNISQKKLYFYRRKMGLVFEDFRLLNNKTVYENVALSLLVTEKEQNYVVRRVKNVLKLTNLTNKSSFYPDELSAGEKQKTAIARAIASSPKLILADEPTGNLDPHSSREIIRLLHDIYRKGTSVIIATHEKEIVDKYRKRVVKIHKGKIVKDIVEGEYI